MILDLGLPGLDGIDVIKGLRGWTEVPIIVLSAREQEADKVLALDAGADDYVTKPFGMDELLARLRAAIRRGSPPEGEEASFVTDHFSVDLAAKRVSNSSGEVRLIPTEWHLVELLLRHEGRLMTRGLLLKEVWVRNITRSPITCVSTWPRSDASWSPIRHIRATSSRSPGWDTASRGVRHDLSRLE